MSSKNHVGPVGYTGFVHPAADIRTKRFSIGGASLIEPFVSLVGDSARIGIACNLQDNDRSSHTSLPDPPKSPDKGLSRHRHGHLNETLLAGVVRVAVGRMPDRQFLLQRSIAGPQVRSPSQLVPEREPVDPFAAAMNDQMQLMCTAPAKIPEQPPAANNAAIE